MILGALHHLQPHPAHPPTSLSTRVQRNTGHAAPPPTTSSPSTHLTVQTFISVMASIWIWTETITQKQTEPKPRNKKGNQVSIFPKYSSTINPKHLNKIKLPNNCFLYLFSQISNIKTLLKPCHFIKTFQKMNLIETCSSCRRAKLLSGLIKITNVISKYIFCSSNNFFNSFEVAYGYEIYIYIYLK